MPFRRLLAELVQDTPRARGAIFCDFEGENVDLCVASPQPAGCGPLSDFDLKIAGAQMAASWLMLREQCARIGSGAPRELKLQAATGTLLCQGLREGYYLVLLLAPGAPSGVAARQMRAKAAQFDAEM